MDMKTIIAQLAFVFSITAQLILLLTFAYASTNDYKATIDMNSVNEFWIEFGLIIIGLDINIAFMYFYWRDSF
jgi:hypothetical protein